jgi:hypothetical protein
VQLSDTVGLDKKAIRKAKRQMAETLAQLGVEARFIEPGESCPMVDGTAPGQEPTSLRQQMVRAGPLVTIIVQAEDATGGWTVEKRWSEPLRRFPGDKTLAALREVLARLPNAEPDPEPAPPPPAVAEPLPPQKVEVAVHLLPPAPGFWAKVGTGPFVCGLVGIVGLGTGAGFGTMALMDRDRADERVAGNQRFIDRGESYMHWANGAYALGGALLVASAIWWALSDEDSVPATVGVGPAGAALYVHY